MGNSPNYSTYHLDELEKALASIDESQNPEEAELIRKYISKGGYTYPSNPPIEKIEFVIPIYKWSLVTILVSLFAFNTYILLAWGTIAAVLPIAVQAAILYMIFHNHKYGRAFIKIWCVLLLVSGVFGFMSMYYAPELIISDLLDHASSLFIGLVYLVLADRSIHLVPYGSNK